MNNMEKIPSFTIDHLHLKRGIYVSRKDTVGNVVVTTFDIRMKEPNREPALSNEAIHTIEHLAATYLRNNDEWKDKIIYWGPMGCLTGNYLIMKGDLQSKDIVKLMQDTFSFIAEYEYGTPIPGANPQDCGNWQMHSLEEARNESIKYLDEVLMHMTEENMVYPYKRTDEFDETEQKISDMIDLFYEANKNIRDTYKPHNAMGLSNDIIKRLQVDYIKNHLKNIEYND